MEFWDVPAQLSTTTDVLDERKGKLQLPRRPARLPAEGFHVVGLRNLMNDRAHHYFETLLNIQAPQVSTCRFGCFLNCAEF